MRKCEGTSEPNVYYKLFLKGSRACPVVNAGDEMAVVDFVIWERRGFAARGSGPV